MRAATLSRPPGIGYPAGITTKGEVFWLSCRTRWRRLGDTLRAFFGWCDSIIRRVARWLTQRFSMTTKDTMSQPSDMPPIYLHPHVGC